MTQVRVVEMSCGSSHSSWSAGRSKPASDMRFKTATGEAKILAENGALAADSCGERPYHEGTTVHSSSGSAGRPGVASPASLRPGEKRALPGAEVAATWENPPPRGG